MDRPCFEVLPLRDGGLSVGRDELAALGLADERVSRAHLSAHHDGEAWALTDEGSTNGTFLDGKPLSGGTVSRSPRVLRVGRTLLLPREDVTLHALHGISDRGGAIVGPLLRVIHDQIAGVGRAGHGLLLTGATGSGKEIAARVFHEAGGDARGARPFIAVNCATLQRELAERSLFGAVRGAYSGAVNDAVGLVQSADGGTLFLDEIGELDLAVQSKLLRAIETREVWPVGAVRATRVDLRLCAATFRDLRGEVLAGRFREDLYFRIGRPEIRLPSLHERPEEIPWLVHRAVESAAPPGQTRRARVELVEACLLRPWPGNVRELLSELRYATISAGAREMVSEARLSATAGLDLASSPGAAPASPDGPVDPIEQALRDEGGNVSRAAAKAGLARGKVRRFIERTGLDLAALRRR